MKQNLQTPATPLEMLSLFLPAGLLDYFDLVNHVSQETCFIFFLEEKPSIPQEYGAQNEVYNGDWTKKGLIVLCFS